MGKIAEQTVVAGEIYTVAVWYALHADKTGEYGSVSKIPATGNDCIQLVAKCLAAAYRQMGIAVRRVTVTPHKRTLPTGHIG